MRSHSFSDFDDFAESIRGVVSKMLLRNAEQQSWRLRSVDLSGMDVQFAQLGSGNIAQGELKADGTLVYLPLTPGVEYSANGNVVEKGSFAILDPGCEFCVSTQVRHDWCAVTFPTHLLRTEAGVENEPDVSSANAQRPTVRTSAVNKQAANRFREIVSQIIAVASKMDGFESSPAALAASSELLKVASTVLMRSSVVDRQAGRPKVSRDQIIARSMTHLEQHGGSAILVGDLAGAADVSERTLRNAFGEYFGVSPVRYLLFRQLHQVHRRLRELDADEASVTEVLVQHGVWEFGRFASRYGRLFGELPSETLHRSRRLVHSVG